MQARTPRTQLTGKTYAEYLVRKMTEEKKSEKAKEKAADEVPTDKFIKWLSEINKNYIPIAGGKGANLAELYNMDMPVPPAFIITAQAFDFFLQHHNLKQEIKKIIESIDIENTLQLEEKAKQIRDIIIKAEMPSKLKEEIIEAYEALNVDPELLKTATTDALAIIKIAREPIFIAVRSSATTEDLSTASFAGQQETFLNVKGNAELIEAVKKCFASLFTARAIYYRTRKGFEHEKSLIAVIIQKMVNSDKSGVIFTLNPLTNNENEILLEAVFGLGEGIVSGTIMPDQYILDKSTLKLKEKQISRKEILLTRTADGRTIKQELPEIKKQQQVLSDYELKQLASYSSEIEQHYKFPQDIEFAVESGKVYILQTRPVTTLEKKFEDKETKGNIILKGLAASPGVAAGVVKIVNNMQDLDKIQKNDILVTKMTNPDMVVTMQKASAIVTDEGGATAHAAIVSREMGIPCVVGTKHATEILKDGMLVTVNGSKGEVYEGKVEAAAEKIEILPVIKTRTEIKVLVDLPDFAERAAKTQVNSIGLLRLEGIIASQGKHPLQYLKENALEAYTELLAEGLQKIARFFPHGSIWIRTSDIRSDEFQHLEGAPQIERNPMLGMHGIRFSIANPELLKAELLAIKRVAEQGFNLGFMLPQVISQEEVKKVKEIMQELEMQAEFGVMIETPAAVEIIEDLCKIVDFVSLGTNDLTQFTLAIDRGNEALQDLYDEMHPAVLSQIATVIKACKKHNVKSSICGQAGSRQDMAAWLVRQGIDSISVNADAAYEISKIVQETEEEFGIKKEAEISKDEEIEEVREKEQDKLEQKEGIKAEKDELLQEVVEEKEEKKETEEQDEFHVEEVMPEELELEEQEEEQKIEEAKQEVRDKGLDIF